MNRVQRRARRRFLLRAARVHRRIVAKWRPLRMALSHVVVESYFTEYKMPPLAGIIAAPRTAAQWVAESKR